MPPPSVELGIQYARDVVSGEILASQAVISQCQSFLDDYESKQHDEDFDWHFVRSKADHLFKFISYLNFARGDVAGEPVKLEPWQCFLLMNVVGWRHKDDDLDRRFIEIYCLVARKNAKTMVLSLLALYELVYGPPASQLCVAATTKEQARELFDAAKDAIHNMHPVMKDDYRVVFNKISAKDSRSTFFPVSKEARSLEGLGIRFAFFDEAALIQNNEVFETITTSMRAFTGSQQFYITTGQAGAKDNPFMWKLDRVRDTLAGATDNERLFALLYELDEADYDQWDNPDLWIKANPSLGGSVKLAGLKQSRAEATAPAQILSFKARFLNIFVEDVTSWISADRWNQNRIPQIDRSLPLNIGCDLGSVNDLTAVTSIYGPDTNGIYFFETKNWLPEASLEAVPKQFREIYMEAIGSGAIELIPGEVTDYGYIRNYILDLASKNDLISAGFDNYNAGELIAQLDRDGINTVVVGQHKRTMNEPSKEFEKLVKSSSLLHEGNPFWAWQMENCNVHVDEMGNYKVMKLRSNSPKKIDSIIAGIIGLQRAMVQPVKKAEFSYYIG